MVSGALLELCETHSTVFTIELYCDKYSCLLCYIVDVSDVPCIIASIRVIDVFFYNLLSWYRVDDRNLGVGDI